MHQSLSFGKRGSSIRRIFFAPLFESFSVSVSFAKSC